MLNVVEFTATNLNNIRKRLGLTIEELSELIECSDRQARRYIKDGISSLETLIYIAYKLNVDFLDLLRDPKNVA